MNIAEGIRINNKHSYGDFGLYLKSRNIGLPEKKSIRQTVPFMNGYYDFSALNGAPAVAVAKRIPSISSTIAQIGRAHV